MNIKHFNRSIKDYAEEVKCPLGNLVLTSDGHRFLEVEGSYDWSYAHPISEAEWAVLAAMAPAIELGPRECGAEEEPKAFPGTVISHVEVGKPRFGF
jgi:hypothetical protein